MCLVEQPDDFSVPNMIGHQSRAYWKYIGEVYREALEYELPPALEYGLCIRAAISVKSREAIASLHEHQCVEVLRNLAREVCLSICRF